MSQKKRKKRHTQAVYDAKSRQKQEQLANDRARYGKRLDPTARSLLFGNLVFLAAAGLLSKYGYISDVVTGLCTLLGIALLFLALWFQFGKKRPGNGGGLSGMR